MSGSLRGNKPSITLYSFPPSQNVVRTEIALLEKGLPFEKALVDLLEGEHRQPPLADLSPRQQVPTLVYEMGGEPIVVYESVATIRFLDDMHPEPALMPPVGEPRRRPERSRGSRSSRPSSIRGTSSGR